MDDNQVLARGGTQEDIDQYARTNGADYALMSREEAQEILDAEQYWSDVSCACHKYPPCDKCVNSPDAELVAEARQVLDKVA